MNNIANMLLDNGCRIWTHPRTGEERIYLNKFALKLLNIEVEYYNTGNIYKFAIGGERTSNSQGRRIMAALDRCYYNVTEDAFYAGNKDVARLLRQAAEEAI